MSVASESFRRRAAADWGQFFALFCLLSAVTVTPLLDRLTSILLLLSTSLFAVVCRFAKRYMAGDPGQARFTLWLCLTGSCVFTLVLSQNLLVFVLAWCGTSLSLHQLLQFYKDRPGALLAARKKFLISRLGDAALIASLILTWLEFKTWNFSEMFAAAARLQENPSVNLSWVAGLLVFAALLKSAQFPFHSWLPDTMETPTPVSALMHAGVINAGGILVLRLSPLISYSKPAMLILCAAGAFTALFASTVMLTQASVKRCLAFSTVAQMGFMMLECGLGAFHLALLHIVAHSLYKAHAFLSSGSVVFAGRRQDRLPGAISPLAAGVGLLAAGGITIFISSLFGVSALHQPVLSGIFVLALAQMLWLNWTTLEQVRQIPVSLLAGIAFTAAYFAWERAAEITVRPLVRDADSLALPILGLFAIATLAQTQLPRLAASTWGMRLFVHARNGFYINTLANRATAALWPPQAAKENV